MSVPDVPIVRRSELNNPYAAKYTIHHNNADLDFMPLWGQIVSTALRKVVIPRRFIVFRFWSSKKALDVVAMKDVFIKRDLPTLYALLKQIKFSFTFKLAKNVPDDVVARIVEAARRDGATVILYDPELKLEQNKHITIIVLKEYEVKEG